MKTQTQTQTQQVELSSPMPIIEGDWLTQEPQEPIFGLAFLKRVHEMAVGKLALTALDGIEDSPLLPDIELIGMEIKRIERDGHTLMMNNQTMLESVVALSHLL